MNDTDPTTCTVRKSPSVAALAKALCAAQAEMENPPKDSVNPHFKSRYADLATVRDTIVPVLVKHKLSVLQLPCECGSGPALTTLLLHESGEWVETTIGLHPSKVDPQGIGSALTYARRYALQSLAGVAADDDDDDDGAAASRPQKPAATKVEAKPAAEADTEPDPVKGRTAFMRLLEAKGKSWPVCVAWMNTQLKPAKPYKADGDDRTKWLDVPEAARVALVEWLRKQSDALPTEAKAGA